MAPDTLEVDISYRIPEAIGVCSGRGAFSEAFNKRVLEAVVRVILLYHVGRGNRPPKLEVQQ
jgi:hypothetical protein